MCIVPQRDPWVSASGGYSCGQRRLLPCPLSYLMTPYTVSAARYRSHCRTLKNLSRVCVFPTRNSFDRLQTLDGYESFIQVSKRVVSVLVT